MEVFTAVILGLYLDAGTMGGLSGGGMLGNVLFSYIFLVGLPYEFKVFLILLIRSK